MIVAEVSSGSNSGSAEKLRQSERASWRKVEGIDSGAMNRDARTESCLLRMPGQGIVIYAPRLKLIAQAEEDGISVMLTEDANTLSRIAARLRESGDVSVRVLLLSEGFTPGRLANPAQGEFPLPTNPE